jgi:hypothetical protein
MKGRWILALARVTLPDENTYRQNRDISAEVKWGKLYKLLHVHRGKEWGAGPTDISMPAGNTLAFISRPYSGN